MQRQIENYINDKEDEMVELLCQLIGANTENPPGNEIAAVNIVKEYFDSCGIEYDIFEKEKSRSNIVGFIGTGKPVLAVVCHLDVVPAGTGWDSDPFKAKLSDGRVYGRGANDNKGQMASMMVLAKFLKQNESLLKGKFILVGAADEEKGSALGAEYLLDECELHADYAVIPDVSHNMQLIDVSEKGALFLEITSFGKQAHGSTPDLGVNAIWNLMELLERIKTLKFSRMSHPYHTPPTINLGGITGGVAPNIVPGECKATLDIRYLPGDTKEEILQTIESIIRDVQKTNTTARFKIKVSFDLLPSEISPDNPLVEIISKHTESVLNIRPKISGMSGATINKQLLAKGIISVGFGPGDNGGAHIANESVDIKEILDFAKIMGLVAFDLL
ncbi:MAG: M20 family metallopeptidase, partial [Candidatus Anammoxibacter sp.]